MRTYSYNIMPLNCKIKFAELTINGIGQYEAFLESMEEKDKKKLFNLIRFIEHKGNGGTLSDRIYRKIHGSINGFEFKKDTIRLYTMFYEDTFYIISVCGYKSTQKNDIKKFCRIEKEYYKEQEEWLSQEMN